MHVESDHSLLKFDIAQKHFLFVCKPMAGSVKVCLLLCSVVAYSWSNYKEEGVGSYIYLKWLYSQINP